MDGYGAAPGLIAALEAGRFLTVDLFGYGSVVGWTRL